MGSFTYEAINSNGEMVTGKMEAEQEASVSQHLRENGLTVVEIKEEQASPFSGLFQSGPAKVTQGDLSLFSRQLASMLDAGIPVTRGLHTLSRQVTNAGFSKALQEIAGNVEGGMSLTEALGGYPHIFSKLYVGMVESGEIGGTLQESLQSVAEQLHKEKALRDNIRSATFYPMVVSFFAVILLIGMLFFLVPVFVGFFPADAQLPLITQIIISVSDSLRNFWYLWFLVIFAVIFLIRLYLRSETGQRKMDRIKFRIPAFGPLLQKAVLARFARTLSTLISGGIPIMQALESAGRSAGNTMIEDAVNRAAEQISEGKSISAPLEESGVFPPMVTHMIAVGEETGNLPDLLNRIAGFFEEEVEVMSKGLTSMIEPLLLVVVGVVVGIMLISLYLPIFTVITEVN